MLFSEIISSTHQKTHDLYYFQNQASNILNETISLHSLSVLSVWRSPKLLASALSNQSSQLLYLSGEAFIMISACTPLLEPLGSVTIALLQKACFTLWCGLPSLSMLGGCPEVILLNWTNCAQSPPKAICMLTPMPTPCTSKYSTAKGKDLKMWQC